jgi:cholera toxin transcriptional activator
MPSDGPRTIFKFGVFEADSATGELRKSGVKIRLPEQPFQVLLMLLERCGEVVTREELRLRLWPADTFVDFDHSLNTVINKLREALGDSASNPRFIQTLSRRGYRFLGAVEAVWPDSPPNNPRAAGPMTAETSKPDIPVTKLDSQVAQPSFPASLLTSLEDIPAVAKGRVRVLFLLVQVMYLIFYVVALSHFSKVQSLLDAAFGWSSWPEVVLIVSAVVAIPIRLYLLAAVAFDVQNLSGRFRRLFPALLVLDELWALSPLLLLPQIGLGLALAATAALAYVPFSQRTLVLMSEYPANTGHPKPAAKSQP